MQTLKARLKEEAIASGRRMEQIMLDYANRATTDETDYVDMGIAMFMFEERDLSVEKTTQEEGENDNERN